MLIFYGNQRKRKILVITAVIIAVLLILIVIPGLRVYFAYSKTVVSAKVAADSLKRQDLQAFKSALGPVRENLKQTQNNFKFFVYLKPVPFLSGYYNDGQHLFKAAYLGLDTAEIAIDNLSPYAAELGLVGSGAQANTQNRVAVVVTVIEKLLPEMDKLSPKLTQMRLEVDQINPGRYPNVGKFKLQDQVGSFRTAVDTVEKLVNDSRPALEILPSVLGKPTPRTYLVLFQNDKEIRPSGGFLTAYTYIKVNSGQITTSGSDDIYKLDERINRVCLNVICDLSPPLPIIKYLPEPNGKPKEAIESRDSNISPDWKEAATEFTRFYNIAGGQGFDGIIAVDTQLVKNLLEITGPVRVGGYETEFSSENVVDELEGYATSVFEGSSRKAVLGDLMNTLFLTIMQSPKEKFQPLVETGIRSLNEKHFLIFMEDQKAQDVAEKFNWAGRIRDYDGDYLAIIDANFAGGKSNLFTTHEVDQNIDIKSDGTVEKTLTITYKNDGEFNARLNPGFRDWFRIYVPKGSELLDSDGSSDGFRTSEELGRTVFDGFQTVRPKAFNKVIVKYKLPFKVKGEYKLLHQKQAGVEFLKNEITLKGKKVEKSHELRGDREYRFKI
ncbi:MAG TPA: DUF4012 domain-containing protein [Patescibacteria group bacterium]